MESREERSTSTEPLAAHAQLGQNGCMVFPWHQPKVNESVRAATPTWRADMYRRDVQHRAALLFRLGRTREEATAAIRRYYEWEFEGLTTPKTVSEIGKLVDAVYEREQPSKKL